MSRAKHTLPCILTWLGASLFVLVVAWLQAMQPGYIVARQLMSELALGPHGNVMILAFIALATAMASLATALARCQTRSALPTLLYLAALCFFGAGLFRLGSATELHVSLMATAFMLCGVSMYLLPRTSLGRLLPRGRTVSWGLGLLMTISVAQDFLPAGASQRLAAGALLAWVCIIALQLFCQDTVHES